MVFSIWSRARVFLNYIFIRKNTKKLMAPLLGLAKKVLNILLSVMDWFHYLTNEKKFQIRVKFRLPVCNKIFTSSRQIFSCIIINSIKALEKVSLRFQNVCNKPFPPRLPVWFPFISMISCFISTNCCFTSDRILSIFLQFGPAKKLL